MNLEINGKIDNPSFEKIKTDFAHENIDWERNVKIKLNQRYFKMNNGVLDITKKAIEPVYNKSIAGQGNQKIRYFEQINTVGSGDKLVTKYTPDVVYFGMRGEIDFDFTEASFSPNYSLFWWLMNHPMCGTEFDLVRPEKDSDNALEAARLTASVNNMFLIKSPAYITDEKLIPIAANYGISNPQGVMIKQLRLQVMKMALADPIKFKKMLGSKELETKAMIQEALDLKVLYYNRADNTYYYTYPPDIANILNLVVDTNRPIYQVRPHLTGAPAEDFAQYLNNVDGNGHLGRIQECIVNQRDTIVKHPSKKGQGADSIKKFADQIVVQNPN